MFPQSSIPNQDPRRKVWEAQLDACPSLADSPPASTPENDDLTAFRVLLKRNMRPQTPPEHLLDDLRARLALLRDEG